MVDRDEIYDEQQQRDAKASEGAPRSDKQDGKLDGKQDGKPRGAKAGKAGGAKAAVADFAQRPIEQIFKICRVVQIANAAVLIVTGLVRIFMVKAYSGESHAFAGFTLSVYLILFGVMLLLVELTIMRARAWFYFLNFGWGKSLFSLFIALFVLGSGRAVRWLDVLLAVYFIIISIFFLFVYLAKRTAEPAYVEDTLIKQMDEKVAAAKKAADYKAGLKA